MNDPEFLHQVMSSLPGVDPNSEAVRSVLEGMQKDDKNKDAKSKDKEEKK